MGTEIEIGIETVIAIGTGTEIATAIGTRIVNAVGAAELASTGTQTSKVSASAWIEASVWPAYRPVLETAFPRFAYSDVPK
jgi:hypothetical protein